MQTSKENEHEVWSKLQLEEIYERVEEGRTSCKDALLPTTRKAHRKTGLVWRLVIGESDLSQEKIDGNR